MGWFTRKDDNAERLREAMKAVLEEEERYERAAGSAREAAKRASEALRAAAATDPDAIGRSRK